MIFRIESGAGDMMFKINDKIVYKEIDDKMVLINLESGFYYSLNELGRFIFSLMLDKMDSPGIIAEIGNRYDISGSRAEQDLQMFIESLEKENILRTDN